MFDGSALTDGYAGVIAEIGTRAQSANYASKVSTSIAQNLETQRSVFRGNEEAAKKAISVGESPVPTDVPPAELAAYTMVANLLLNLDEVVTKD